MVSDVLSLADQLMRLHFLNGVLEVLGESLDLSRDVTLHQGTGLTACHTHTQKTHLVTHTHYTHSIVFSQKTRMDVVMIEEVINEQRSKRLDFQMHIYPLNYLV